eukprot:TRINITY_DN4041_c0_g1_i1.p1 TRINITY_DN4041_c0_g1~~TRINITY_DN4041_c0_g1_i1.p1  ORF type:complete len:256 (+),score=53.30 TRINITY_DN4041_c0_g1_i1:351-1118(+)
MDLNPQGYRNPTEYQLPFEDVRIRTSDNIQLHGWFIKQDESRIADAPTIVYFHENAGNLGTRLPYLKHYYNQVGANILVVAYRGYSKSEGSPSELGLQEDSKAVLNYIFNRGDVNKQKVFIHGRSLGGAVTAYALTEGGFNDRVAGVILENTFKSISDMVDVVFPKLSYFKNLVLRNHWPTIHRIGRVTKPILFIMSIKDEIVPLQHMLDLYVAKKTGFRDKYEIPDGNHNMNWSLNPEEYFNKVKDFINTQTQK